MAASGFGTFKFELKEPILPVLSFLFPGEEALLKALAKKCSESRFEGGVHFRTDNEVGLKVGDQVGRQVIKAFTTKRNQV